MDLNNQNGQQYSSGKGATLSPEHKRKISEAMKRKSALISANVSASFTPEKRQAYADRIRGFSKEETARRSRKTGDTNVSEIGDVVNELANYNLVLVPDTYKSASSPFQVYTIGREQEPYLTNMSRVRRAGGKHPADLRSNMFKTAVERGHVKYPGLVQFCKDKQIPYSTLACRYVFCFPKDENETYPSWYERLATAHAETSTSPELQVRQWLDSLGITYLFNRRLGRYRPDFLFENARLVVEIDGAYWHSERRIKDNNRHRNKQEYFENLGYRLLVVYEQQAYQRLDLVKSAILGGLGLNQTLHAADCTTVHLTDSQASSFFMKNCLNGFGRGKCLGLINDNMVVAALQYDDTDKIRADRYCSSIGYSINGGYQRLLAELPPQTIALVDCRYKNEELPGFQLLNEYVGFEWTNGWYRCDNSDYPNDSGYAHKLYKVYDYGRREYTKKEIDSNG